MNMSRYALVDWTDDEWHVVPWMAFATLDELLRVRRTAHSSWPYLVACIGAEPSKRVRGRHGGTVEAYRRIGPVQPFYDINVANLPPGWALI
jgi:hypothetical protein